MTSAFRHRLGFPDVVIPRLKQQQQQQQQRQRRQQVVAQRQQQVAAAVAIRGAAINYNYSSRPTSSNDVRTPIIPATATPAAAAAAAVTRPVHAGLFAAQRSVSCHAVVL